MAVIESDGRWQSARKISPPADAARSEANGSAGLTSVTCAPDGRCLAVGNYVTAAGVTRGLVITEENGHLGRAAGITEPLTTVTCPATFCVSADGDVMLSYSGGRWRQIGLLLPAATVVKAANRGEQLYGVEADCFAGGQCVAIGALMDTQGKGSLFVSTRLTA
jgi:hypothetical protein